MTSNIRVFLVHRNRAIQEGLCSLLEFYDGIEVVGTSTGMEQAFAQMAGLAPDVFVVDVRAPDITHLEVTPELTISVSRDQEGKPVVNVTAFKERAPLGEVAVIGRYAEQRVQLIDVDQDGYRVREDKRDELASAIVQAAKHITSLRAASDQALQTSEDNPAQLRPSGRTNGSFDLQSLGPPAYPASNGNGAHNITNGNGRHNGTNGNGHHNGTNGNGNGHGNEAIFEEELKTWFDSVTSPAVDSQEDVNGEDLSQHVDAANTEHEGSTEETHIDTLGTNALQESEQEESVEPWMNMWQLPPRRNDTEKNPQVELVFPPSVEPANLYNFVRRLKKATKAETKGFSGSITEGTSVQLMVHKSTPLLEIMRAAPEVAEANREISQQQYGALPPEPSPGLPRKIHVSLTRYEEARTKQEVKQLKLQLTYDSPPVMHTQPSEVAPGLEAAPGKGWESAHEHEMSAQSSGVTTDKCTMCAGNKPHHS